MILLTVEEVTALHDKLIERTGGSHGLRDQSLLESAVYNAMSVFGDNEAYPSVEEKLHDLCFRLLTITHLWMAINVSVYLQC